MGKTFNVGDIVRVWNNAEVFDDFFEVKEKYTRLDIFTFPRVQANFYKLEGFMYGRIINNVREQNMVLIKNDDRFINELLDKLIVYDIIEAAFKTGEYLEKKKKLLSLMKKKFPKKRKAKNA